MASANVAVSGKRDWLLANPWIWIGLSLLLCAWAWLWARTFGPIASDNRIGILAAGLAAAGLAVALRLNSSRPALVASLPWSLQSQLLLVLAWIFFLISLIVTGILAASVFALAEMPVYPGLAVILWLVLAPIGIAAWLRLLRRRARHEDVSASDETAALLLLTSLAAFIGACSLDLGENLSDDWDSIRFFLRSISFAILIGAALAAASVRARRLTISLLVLFHFGGICTAALAAPPSPWLVTQIWTRIYRPYLEFMYLNNAYHFYAPEPGASNYVWLRLIYVDPEGQEVGVWYKAPRVDGDGRPQHHVALEYQRYVAMTEGLVPTEGSVAIVVIDEAGRADYAPFFKRRMAAVPNQGIVVGVEKPAVAIPFDPTVPQAQQYMPPSKGAKILVEAFARHAGTLLHPDDEKDPEHPRYRLRSVKLYRVIHAVPGSAALALGLDALRDPTMFRPFYLGEYSPEGKLLDPEDPFLYWLLPTMRVPREGYVEIRNYAAYHAGDRRYCLTDGRNNWREPDEAP